MVCLIARSAGAVVRAHGGRDRTHMSCCIGIRGGTGNAYQPAKNVNHSRVGFMIFNACGGGTGSGLGCLLLERLSVDYGKKSKISFTVWSCPQISSACVEPYNTVLCVHSLLEHTDVTNQVDNASRIHESIESLNVLEGSCNYHCFMSY